MKKSIFIILAMLMFGTLAVAQQVKDGEKIKTDRPFLNNDKIDHNVRKKMDSMRHNRNGMSEFRGKRQGGMFLFGISDLTDNQKTKIKEIRLAERKQSLQIRNQIAEKRAKLRSLETADNANLNEINKVIDETAKLQADRMKLRAESKQKTRALLTDEQRIEFDTKRNNMGKMMNKGFSKHGNKFAPRAGKSHTYHNKN